MTAPPLPSPAPPRPAPPSFLAALAAMALLLALFASVASAQSSSPGWRLERSTVNGGGAETTSASWRVTASAGQESAIGASSSFSHVLQSGFWGYGGSGLVPVILTATKNGIDPSQPDLAWSGNNPPYAVYGGTNCPSVTAGFLATTPTNGWTDPAPPVADLVCYGVFATAPGPLPSVGNVSPDAAGTLRAR